MDGLWLASYLALWVVVIIQIVLMIGLARELGVIRLELSNSGILPRDQGLGIGTVAPDFDAQETPTGREVRFRAGSGRDTLIAFVSLDCSSCQAVLPELASVWRERQRQITVHIVCEGDEVQTLDLAARANARVPMIPDPDARIRGGFKEPPLPFAFLVGGDGTIKSKGVVRTRKDIEKTIGSDIPSASTTTTIDYSPVDPMRLEPAATRSEFDKEALHGKVD